MLLIYIKILKNFKAKSEKPSVTICHTIKGKDLNLQKIILIGTIRIVFLKKIFLMNESLK